MRKTLSLLLALVLLFPVFVFPTTASADAKLGYFPVNYSYNVTHEAGAALLNIQMYNNTDKEIERIEVVAFPRDVHDDPMYYYGDGDCYYNGVAEAEDLNMKNRYDYAEGTWVMYGFDEATNNTMVRIDRVYFADGTVWRNEQSTYYEEANFEVLNADAGYNTYEINSSHVVKLRETGYSIYRRDWYIWEDEHGWIWFSDEFEPTCEVWEETTKIKLVINCDQKLQKVMEFRVEQRPEFLLKYRLGDKMLISSGEENEFIVEESASIPYYIDLWDLSEADVDRSWYIWDEEAEGWLLFSYDRGPACELWTAGEHKIALAHNGDLEHCEVFKFSIK